MLPGRWGFLPLREKTLNPIDYAKQSWPVSSTEKENVFGKQGETLPVYFPAPSGVVLAKTATSARPGRTASSSPRLWGSSRCCAHVRTESLCKAAEGKLRLPRAAEAAGAARVAPARSKGRCEKGRARSWKRIFARLERLINIPVPSSQPA